jgi:sigma-B regulation protein RsbU (phosphoserine phosphatase)
MSFKILVVDDEADLELLVRQKFRKKIRDGEFEFVFALNGQEALDKLKDDSGIGIVLSDINMPVMDGLTLLSRLTDVNRILKAVIVSAYGDLQNIRLAMNRGAYDFLTKPIDFEDFEVTINKTIRELETIKQGVKARDQLAAIRNELTVAARIQESILPGKDAPFPDRKEFEIYGEMIPARHVGGDFYDFFLLDDRRLGFVIGDVSGKGVPAAIFMAVTQTLLRATALQGGSPGQCLQYVNTVLSRQSDPSMFVTMFYAILHTDTGEMEYCIGGHNPPYVFSGHGSGNGKLQALGSPCCLVVGALENAAYETGTLKLAPGDGIFLFTDGVTETRDPNGVDFSENGLEYVLEKSQSVPAQEMVKRVINGVTAFALGAPQADDITCLALRYLG